MTPEYAVKCGFKVFTLEQLTQEIGGELPPIHGIGRIKTKAIGVCDHECEDRLYQGI